ncbi:UNKNOWN [Stylonychia lemnae]|uniref:Uncharacterized protein n=1 Tax=Stylonychia lemnae TaxID=5949 RepID=A0A078AY10_STYLE|nr:UNKNOWN [Stylonychia lemnae]|eukprot:CDW87001.1 UNKNOWN [Stylonychia lemnae]
MGREMRDLIRGVVKDHRLPNDYKFAYNQPVLSSAFLKQVKRFIATRQMTKTHATTPMVVIFGFALPFSILATIYHYMYNGYWPHALQPQNQLYRKGNYAQQHAYNMNPDNHYNSNQACWTTDPMCGLDIAPKRPWELLKNPEQNLFKFERESTQDKRREINGYRLVAG